jgi:hypothetical protein
VIEIPMRFRNEPHGYFTRLGAGVVAMRTDVGSDIMLGALLAQYDVRMVGRG